MNNSLQPYFSYETLKDETNPIAGQINFYNCVALQNISNIIKKDDKFDYITFDIVNHVIYGYTDDGSIDLEMLKFQIPFNFTINLN